MDGGRSSPSPPAKSTVTNRCSKTLLVENSREAYSIFKECFHRDAQITGNSTPLCRQKRTIHSNRTWRGRAGDAPVLGERGQRGQARSWRFQKGAWTLPSVLDMGAGPVQLHPTALRQLRRCPHHAGPPSRSLSACVHSSCCWNKPPQICRLKQHKGTVSPSGGQKSKAPVSQGRFLWGLPGEYRSVSLPFSAPRGRLPSLAHGPFPTWHLLLTDG